MPRKSMVELQADLLTFFPDNITGLITPEIVRNYFNNVIEAIRPAYGLLSRLGPTVQTLEIAFAPVVFDTGYTSDVPDYTNAPAVGTLTRLEAGSTRLTFNATLEGGNGRLVKFIIYKNGVETNWRASVTLLGAGKPVDVTITAFSYEGAQAVYQLQAAADTAGTAVTFSFMDLLAETVPVNSY